jgi:hypothetical protein
LHVGFQVEPWLFVALDNCQRLIWLAHKSSRAGDFQKTRSHLELCFLLDSLVCQLTSVYFSLYFYALQTAIEILEMEV